MTWVFQHSQQLPCIMFTLAVVANEFEDGACMLLPDIVMFPAGCGKAEGTRREKVAKKKHRL